MDKQQRAAAVTVRDGRVLTVHEGSRRATGGEWWTQPGGGIGPDESPEEALGREVPEDTGLMVLDGRPFLETVQHDLDVLDNRGDGEAYLGADPGEGRSRSAWTGCRCRRSIRRRTRCRCRR